MKIAITGAGGFIGKNLLLGLSERHHILAFARGGSVPEFIEEHGLEKVETVLADFTVPETLEAAARKFGSSLGTVIYLAGNGNPAYSVSRPDRDLLDTVLGLVNFLRVFEVDRLIYFSSGAVYDGISGPVSPESSLNPRLPYAIGKLACEQYIKFFKKIGRIDNYVILRFFGAYGPYEPPRKIYTKLVKAFALEKRREFTIRGDGKNLIDAMFVDDTVRAIETILETPGKDMILDFCCGKPFTLRKLVEESARIFGVDAEIKTEGDVPEYIDFRPSPAGMEELFGFRPQIPLSEGLPILAEHLATR